jgi:hypothetical protein
MGFVPINNQSSVDKIHSLLHRDASQKEFFTFNHNDISPHLSLISKKSFFWNFFGASAKIAKNLLPASSASEATKMEIKKKKIEFLQKESEKVIEFDIKFENDLTINGMAIFLDSDHKRDFKDRKTQNQNWIIFFNDNESFYENQLINRQATGKDLDANALVFNYRGVGESRGVFSDINDLKLDAELCVRYLMSNGISEKNILFQGLALGAAVGMQLAALYEKIKITAIGCFSSLSKAASARVPFSGQFLASFGWDLDCLDAYKKIKADKLIVFHKQDGVVPYHESSLYKALKEEIKHSNLYAAEQKMHKGIIKSRLKAEYKPIKVKLRNPFDSITDAAHNYTLSSDLAYDEIKKIQKNFFLKT